LLETSIHTLNGRYKYIRSTSYRNACQSFLNVIGQPQDVPVIATGKRLRLD